MATKKAASDLLDVSAYMAELDEFRKRKLAPVTKRIEAIDKELSELEEERDELQAVADQIEGVSRQPKRGRSSGARRSGGSLPDVPDGDIVSAVPKEPPVGRSFIMQKLGLDEQNSGLKVKVSNVLARLADEGKLKKKGEGRGTVYTRA